MKILFLSVYDWANVTYKLAQSMLAVDVESRAICLKVHPLSHLPEERADLADPQEHLDWADIIVCCHSEMIDIKTDKPVYVFHGGTRYREGFEELNKFWNPRVEASFLQTQCLFGLGAKNEIELPMPIDTTLHKPAYKRVTSFPVKFGHFPTSPFKKGSEAINYAFYKAACEQHVDYAYDATQREWPKHLTRLKSRDVIVDHMSGAGWGANGAEAAALGKIVIARMTREKEYEEEFGPCEIIRANDEKELTEKILEINMMSASTIRTKQIATREWAKKHSYKNTGARLKRIFDGER